MKQDVILVLDCGATNVRAMAVDRQGNIIARAATANASDIAAEKSDWHQWSLEAIMQRFADCCRQIHDQLASCTVRGITVTTFGVDGALVDEQGELLYPIISWKCPRTAAVMDTISRYMPARQLQQIAGVGAFAFNTLYKLIWLKENHPQLLAQAHAWLFISSLINHRLTGEFTTDLTMAGTSQMLDLRQRDFSEPILQATGLPRRLFPRLVEAGQPIGALLPEAAALLGLPVGIPVISAGHDTQFALFGAGAGQDEPVLSSGTWEILMVRSAQVDTSLLGDYSGSTCELDSQPGRYNPGMQWLASGVLEWVRKLLWNADTPWQTLIDEAQAIPPGAQGVRMQCDLLASQHAGWQGVTLNTTRGHFYRAALEGLSDQLAQHLQTLENIGRFRAQELLLVGGGSRNALWNQIKADRLGIPIKVLDDAETTVAGAAMFGWYGVGEFSSPEQARAQVAYRYRYFWPQTEAELTEEA
ncbi:TPA: L-fuculokinase [Klebsiella quasipneumoniae]|nr:L-fuculokinase [Klebsiella quasipneumoniae]